VTIQSCTPARVYDPKSTIDDYLREVGETPLLTKDQEVELAQAIAAGNDAARTLAEGLVSDSERTRLYQVIRDGCTARDQMIQANLRLVVAVARQYTSAKMPLADLIQEGNIGLMRAVEKFDHTRGNRFSTYATWWIRQAIGRASRVQGNTIVIPVHMSEKLDRLRREIPDYEWTTDAIQEVFGCNERSARNVFMAMRVQPVSIDQRTGENDDSTLADFVADSFSTDLAAEGSIIGKRVRDAFVQLAGCFDGQRKTGVIAMRYGIDGEQHTLEQVGNHFGITRERARQIEKQALADLRVILSDMEAAYAERTSSRS
jgi:RNA polymerase sigma factor (sigma-70 family)